MMESREDIPERIARLEEKMIAADKALGLAQESIFQRAALESRVSVLEASVNRDEGKKSGYSSLWAIIVAIISIGIAVVSLLKK